MRKLIRKLSDMRGISGHEYRLTDKISEMFSAYCDEVNIDQLGSVIAVRHCGIPNAPKLMIEAHCDEIGLMVTSITDEGHSTWQRGFVGSNRHKACAFAGKRQNHKDKGYGC